MFPAALGEMQARQTTTYGAGDASVYYTLAGAANVDPWLTLYVYPVTTEWSAEIAGVEGSIVQRMGKPIPMPQGLPRATSGTAEKWFDGTVDGVPVTTGYRLVRQGNWYLKVRLSIPVSGGEAGLRRAWGALGAVPWSMPVSGERRPVASSDQGNPAGAARTGDR